MEKVGEDNPAVAVVIPTCERAGLVSRAVDSVLRQTLAPVEVIVVVDGRDQTTLDVLARISDLRLRVIVPEQRLGGSGARNLGTKVARAQWVAFLDDDDEWRPRKLEFQLAAAGDSALRWPIVSCRLIARTKTGDRIWPRRPPRAGEAVGDYLFRRGSLAGGEGFVQTSTLFGPRELFLEVPFRDLPINQDLDWLLRACAKDGAGLIFAGGEEPLAIWDNRDDRPRISTATDWRRSLEWIRDNRRLVSDRAYASFLLTWVSLQASRGSGWEGFDLLLDEAFRRGRPSWLDLAVHAGHWFLPVRGQEVVSQIVSASARR